MVTRCTLIVSLWLLTLISVAVDGNRSPQGRSNRAKIYFDDYLISIFPESILQVNNSTTTTTVSPSGGSQSQGRTDRVTDLDILGYFRDVPRQHWSCCMLGKLAGDKGFHCRATFYATRIARRNINRAHSRKMLFHGPRAIRNWGRDIMTTFSRCINTHEEEFHRCCYVATVEVTERQRWQSYRERHESSGDHVRSGRRH